MPYAGYTRMKAGKGIYVNISRDRDDYQMLLAPCEMLHADEDNFPGAMRGWMRHETSSTAEFLENLSKNGATHHSTFIYGATVEELQYFAKLLSLKTVVI
jgi:L-arabinose isomerase